MSGLSLGKARKNMHEGESALSNVVWGS